MSYKCVERTLHFTQNCLTNENALCHSVQEKSICPFLYSFLCLVEDKLKLDSYMYLTRGKHEVFGIKYDILSCLMYSKAEK